MDLLLITLGGDTYIHRLTLGGYLLLLYMRLLLLSYKWLDLAANILLADMVYNSRDHGDCDYCQEYREDGCCNIAWGIFMMVGTPIGTLLSFKITLIHSL